MLTGAITFFKEEYERLTAENIHLLMEIETLKERITNSKGGKKKKTYSQTPQPSLKKKKRGRKPGSKGTSRKVPDHVDDYLSELCEIVSTKQSSLYRMNVMSSLLLSLIHLMPRHTYSIGGRAPICCISPRVSK